MAAYEDQQSIAAMSTKIVLPPRCEFPLAASLCDEEDASPSSSSSSSSDEESSIEDMEIFVQSPSAARRRQRMQSEEKAMCCARTSSRNGIRRVATTVEGWPGSQTSCKAGEELRKTASEPTEQQIKKRAAEHTMVANLKQLVFKQQLRFRHVGSEDVSPSHRLRDRQQVRSAAQDFQVTYGKTLDIFQENMTSRPPSRRHSITMGDLLAYSIDDSNTRRHSCDCSMGPVAVACA